MHRRRLALSFGLAALACGDSGVDSETATNTSNVSTNTQGATGASATAGTTGATSGPTTSGTGGGAGGPSREEWRLLVDAPFPLDVVETITIGRVASGVNFRNRGDVEVRFDLPDERITIELRAYTFQASVADATADLAALSLWAYAGAGAPKPPAEMDPASECAKSWKDDCTVTIYYAGAEQPAVVGADLRVHLPAAYRQHLVIETEDNLSTPLYPLRGDVVVRGLCGSGEVQLASGVADVHLCRELSPAPTCDPAAVAACEAWTIDDGQGGQIPAPWDPTCPCTSFGALKVESTDPEAARITIDLPASVWAYAVLDNRAIGQSVDGDHCTASAQLPGCGGACVITQSPATPWKLIADLNFPGPPAIQGAGYAISAVSNGCGPVPFADDPEDYDPNAQAPAKAEARGDLLLCDGCLE